MSVASSQLESSRSHSSGTNIISIHLVKSSTLRDIINSARNSGPTSNDSSENKSATEPAAQQEDAAF